jgi:hypothetical protein
VEPVEAASRYLARTRLQKSGLGLEAGSKVNRTPSVDDDILYLYLTKYFF